MMPTKFAGLARQNQRPQIFLIQRINSAATLERQWVPTLARIFTDPQDLESNEQLAARLHEGEDFFLMWDADKRKPAGIELTEILPQSGAMYIPWTGVLPEYRNLDIGAAMTNHISGFMKQQYGATHTLIDIEDPQRLHNSSYAPEELDEAIALAARRINFWRRQNFVVVDDHTRPVGEKLSYMRPAGDDDQKIQAYDHMAVRFDDPALRARVMTADGRISKAFVRGCYLDMNRIQYGKDLAEEQLRDSYPAIDQYCRNIDAVKEDTLPTRTDPLTPKASPTGSFTLAMAEKAPVPFMSAANSSRRPGRPACGN